MPAPFYLIIGFAERCACRGCHEWIGSKGRKRAPCRGSHRLAAQLAEQQRRSQEVTAQSADRMPDLDGDELGLPVQRAELSEVDEFLLELRQRDEENGTRRAATRRGPRQSLGV